MRNDLFDAAFRAHPDVIDRLHDDLVDRAAVAGSLDVAYRTVARYDSPSVCTKGSSQIAKHQGCRPARRGPSRHRETAPHDLRRTCARLCHLAGGELDQIQFLLGHVSIQTTERYLGCKQKLRRAVNDTMGLEPDTLA